MDATGLLDHDVAQMVRPPVSRSHISRIRRLKSGANKAIALELQRITKIDWSHFIEPLTTHPRRNGKKTKKLRLRGPHRAK
jgi:hypothetical protein